ncbi:MAG: hypothetical protein QOJ73_2474 [Streptosporangiaceae bacterium]|nr:hypothetical protein [Streptosporangiaceae bacterium]
MVSGDRLLDVLGQVVPQVPPIGHLDRLGCPTADAFGVGTGTVPADHPGSRVLTQPRGEGGGLAIGEQIDGATRVDVDEYGAVDVPAAQGKVIDPEHRHGADLRVGQGSDHP